ncbi:hypothetical protein NN561_007913 [Cricetulus griseus]
MHGCKRVVLTVYFHRGAPDCRSAHAAASRRQRAAQGAAPPGQAPCELYSKNTSAAVGGRGSLSKPPAEDRGELSREAGNDAQPVGLGAGAQLQLASLLDGLKRRLPAHTREAEAQEPTASRA